MIDLSVTEHLTNSFLTYVVSYPNIAIMNHVIKSWRLHIFCFQDFLKTQLVSSDVSTLDLSGTEQLTDAFFYMIYDKQINFPCLNNMSLNGLYLTHLSPIMSKLVFGGLRPGKPKTNLLSYRNQLETLNFGYSKSRYHTK